MKLIDKDKIVAEIERILKNINLNYVSAGSHSSDSDTNKKLQDGISKNLQKLLSFLDTLDVKEVNLDALGVLAEHLIACDAHLVTPKYTDKELDLLEELTKNNKQQKGE